MLLHGKIGDLYFAGAQPKDIAVALCDFATKSPRKPDDNACVIGFVSVERPLTH